MNKSKEVEELTVTTGIMGSNVNHVAVSLEKKAQLLKTKMI